VCFEVIVQHGKLFEMSGIVSRFMTEASIGWLSDDSAFDITA
jgi:hypothetical protein